MIRLPSLILTVAAFCGCGDRAPSVAPDDVDFSRFEAPDEDNACATDLDCVASGCSDEICAAVSLVSTCELRTDLPSGDCGCVDRVCQWWLPPVTLQTDDAPLVSTP